MTDLKMDVWVDDERSKFIVGWTLDDTVTIETIRAEAHRVLDIELDYLIITRINQGG